MFVMFTEINDWEGETWSWFIPIEGNEDDIEKVRALIEPMQDVYSLSEKQYTEEEVQTLMDAPSDTTYMDRYQKASGFETIPESVDWDNDDPFYKGQMIKD